MSGAAHFFRQLSRQIMKLENEVRRTVIVVEAEKFHAENFRRQGFTDQSFRPWKARKGRQKGRRRFILVKSGVMRRHATSGKIRGQNVDFVMPLPYMRVHNEGLQAGRGKGFQMPKRQYIGRSRELEKRIKRKAIALINRRLNRL